MIPALLSLVLPAHALTLEEAWAAAGADSEEVTLISEQRLQSGLVRNQAWAALSPKLTLTGNWTLNQRETALDFSGLFPPEMLDLIESFTGEPVSFGDPLVINQKQYFDWNLTIVQPIFSGKALPGLLGAMALARAGEAQERQSLAQLRLGVARAYWGVLVAREAERISTEGLELAKAHAAIAASLIGAGSATPQIGLQAEMAVARAERDLYGARARRAQAEQAFAALTGLDGQDGFSPPAPAALPYSDVEDAVSRALDQRPDLDAMEQQARAMRMQRLASQLSWLPDINARFTEAYTENGGFSGENYTWMFVATASWTFWDGGFRLAENARTASQARQAEAGLDKTVEDIRLSVRTAWEERARAALALAAVERELNLARENLRLAEVSVKEGAAPWIDAEDARLALAAAELGRLSEQMSLDLATRSLLLATGDF